MIFQTQTKINIGLYVTKKRIDGFHNISSVFYPLAYGDILEITPDIGHGEINFEVYGVKIPGKSQDNLCVKAYEILHRDYNLPSIKSNLLKRVPIGAGLGGGSSDGVEMLKAINTMFSLSLATKELEKYALELGSDCPFFVENKPKLIGGRGEIMDAIDLNIGHFWIVLVFPEFHISTPKAYSLVVPNKPNYNLKNINELAIDQWKETIRNDFEIPISRIHPEVEEIKNSLYNQGALYASMTGSGSTIYGIFEDRQRLNLGDYRYVTIE